MAETLIREFDDYEFAIAEPSSRCAAITSLHQRLFELRESLESNEWRVVCKSLQSHSLHERLLEDPFTRRCFEKPKGYPGDPWLIDYLYRTPDDFAAVREASELGRTLAQYNLATPGSRSVGLRRDHLTELVLETIVRNQGVRILSIASGFLREIDPINSVLRTAGVEYHAIDQDPKALEHTAARHGDLIHTHNVKIRDFMARELELPKFDLIYATGLCDYLDDNVFARFLRAAYDYLSPGGAVVFANVGPPNPNYGYIEAAMDWMLIVRNETDLKRLALAAELPGAQVRVYPIAAGMVVLLRVEKPRDG